MKLETGLKEAVRLNPAADILFTLDDLAKTGVKHTPDDIVKVIRKQRENLID